MRLSSWKTIPFLMQCGFVWLNCCLRKIDRSDRGQLPTIDSDYYSVKLWPFVKKIESSCIRLIETVLSYHHRPHCYYSIKCTCNQYNFFYYWHSSTYNSIRNHHRVIFLITVFVRSGIGQSSTQPFSVFFYIRLNYHLPAAVKTILIISYPGLSQTD